MSDYVLPYNAISKTFSYSDAIVEFDRCVNEDQSIASVIFNAILFKTSLESNKQSFFKSKKHLALWSYGLFIINNLIALFFTFGIAFIKLENF